ncbi:helix-turn-helix domain-containing protein [Halovenus sp. HT40]|uniref:helix-turn-helix domain-containing protein n=1 Tax=Halovenus sp. HT40 TaxID=3126691 RepID=UPI00300EB886
MTADNSITILNFLAANDEQAFTQPEIHEATDIPRGSVSVVLSRLEDRGLVRHRGRYWAITDDKDRLQSAYRLHRRHETADDQYGEERLENLQTEDTEAVDGRVV